MDLKNLTSEQAARIFNQLTAKFNLSIAVMVMLPAPGARDSLSKLSPRQWADIYQKVLAKQNLTERDLVCQTLSGLEKDWNWWSELYEQINLGGFSGDWRLKSTCLQMMAKTAETLSQLIEIHERLDFNDRVATETILQRIREIISENGV